MYIHIKEVSTAKDTGLTYILADFWRTKTDYDKGQKAFLTNDFLMQLRPTGQRIIMRADGWLKLTSGDYISPRIAQAKEEVGEKLSYEREAVTNDLRTQILDNIRNYWQSMKDSGLSGDHTGDSTKPLYWRDKLVVQKPTPAIVRDDSDPHQVLEREDVVGLRDTKIEDVAAVGP